jgi:hypothetical protein
MYKVKCEGVKDTEGQHDTLGGPAGSHTSQLDLIMGYQVSDMIGYFVQLFCDWGR